MNGVKSLVVLSLLVGGCNREPIKVVEPEAKPEVKTESYYEQGYKLGMSHGKEIGMTSAYCFMQTNPSFTNYIDFQAQCLAWSSNAVAMYQKSHEHP